MAILRVILLILCLTGCAQLTIQERLLNDVKGQPKETVEAFYAICEMANKGEADWQVATNRGAPSYVIADTANTAGAFAEAYRKRSLENPFDIGAKEMIRFFETCSQKFQLPEKQKQRDRRKRELTEGGQCILKKVPFGAFLICQRQGRGVLCMVSCLTKNFRSKVADAIALIA